ncbi:MAG: HAMP domain-containing sensor histidine kinase [Mariprofundaceae bacterium]|nr:HAMP domain-containing sensor histidine kinase [Mariprofundaceae bacterium]
MNSSGYQQHRRFFQFSWRRLLHSAAYFLAIFFVLAVFFVALVLAESTFYAVTGRSVSIWALILAALAAALLFSPLVHVMQRGLDHLFFRRHLDVLQAIRHLGADDLAGLPLDDVEQALLARICEACHRKSAALDEREITGREAGYEPEYEAGSGICVWPSSIAAPPVPETSPPMRLADDSHFELCLKLPRHAGHAWLYLGPHEDGKPTDEDEIETLKGLGKFASMSLEYARLTRRQAERARLDSLSRVAGQLHSHDLKNRLNDLSFLAHNISAGTLGKEDIGHLVTAISKVTGRMQMLMQRLDDPQTPLNPDLSPLDISGLLADAIASRLWPEGIEIVSDLPSLSPVSGDTNLLGGMFENLFDNAVQAMQRQGKLVVSAVSGIDSVEIRIKDNGCGMKPDFIRRRLFRLFSTSKENGLGIGLYLSKRIVEAHHGRMWAESAGEGKGCTFHVRLPLWQAR